MLAPEKKTQAKEVPNGTSKALSKVEPTITKEEYMAKQSQIFEELTGYKSWDSWRKGVYKESDAIHPRLGSADEDNDTLMFALKVTMAALDDDTYNEVLAQRAIDAQFQLSAKNDTLPLNALPGNKAKVQYFATKYRELREHMNDLEVQFLSSRKLMAGLVDSEAQARQELDASMINNQRLTTMCSALESKIRFMTKDCENHQEEISRLSKANSLLQDEINELKKEHSQRTKPDEETVKLKTEIDRLKSALNESKAKSADTSPSSTTRTARDGDNLEESTTLTGNSANSEKSEAKKILNPSETQQHKVEKESKKSQSEALGAAKQPRTDKNADMKATESTKRQANSSAVRIESNGPAEASALEHHPMLQGLLDKFDLQGEPSPVEVQMAAVRREYPELLQGKLKRFYEQYEAREKYFLQHLRVNQLRLHVMKGKYDKEVRLRDTDMKRLAVLSEQIEASSKAEVNMREFLKQQKAEMDTLKVDMKQLKLDAETTTDRLNATLRVSKEDEEYFKTTLTKMTSLVEDILHRNSKLMKRCESLEKEIKYLKDDQAQNKEQATRIGEEAAAQRKLALMLMEDRDQLEFTIAKIEGDILMANLALEQCTKKKDEISKANKRSQAQLAKAEQELAELKREFKNASPEQAPNVVSVENNTKSETTVPASTPARVKTEQPKSVTPKPSEVVQQASKPTPDQSAILNSTLTKSTSTTAPKTPSDLSTSNNASTSEPSTNPPPTVKNSADNPYSKTPEAELAERLIKQFEGHADPAAYYKSVYGFDITGVPVHKWLQHFSEEESCKCADKECPIHSKEATFRQGWSTLMDQISSVANGAVPQTSKPPGPVGRTPPSTPPPAATPTDKANGHMINGKRVFGPERPPSMQN